ncbi:MAG: hypothetical protein M0Q92_14870 [Methanoregula sp.]|nr:hypothetical protein [Methanoregula sp.]
MRHQSPIGDGVQYDGNEGRCSETREKFPSQYNVIIPTGNFQPRTLVAPPYAMTMEYPL